MLRTHSSQVIPLQAGLLPSSLQRGPRIPRRKTQRPMSFARSGAAMSKQLGHVRGATMARSEPARSPWSPAASPPSRARASEVHPRSRRTRAVTRGPP
eukprot:6658918-Pyramimonas_sp.AAC.1